MLTNLRAWSIISIVAKVIRKDVCLAQLDRAFGYGPKGRGFESSNTRCMTRIPDKRHPGFCYIKIRKKEESDV